MELNGVSNSSENTLHHALGPFLVLASFFGVFPLSGIWTTAHVANLRFRWCSLPLLVSFTLIGYSAMDVFLSLKMVFELGFSLNTGSPLSFSIICLCAFSVFLLLARNWPNLKKQTRHLETVFLRESYACRTSKRFSSRLRVVGAVLLCGAVVEHLSYVGSAIYGNHLHIKACNLSVNFWESYFLRERMQIFSIVSYTVWLTPLVVWITISMTFAWNFVDIFLILVCRGAAMRFQQLHWRIARHAQKHMPSDFWHEVCRDFLMLNQLLSQSDDTLAGLILLSCSNNLYFICVQVFYSFQQKGNFMNEIYFWCSLIFVLTRILAMMFSAAGIHDAASAISATLYEIPTDHWCLELKRLNEVIVADTIALSGKGFFYLTRRLIFAMMGTIVIYELVLIDQIEDAELPQNICALKLA